MLPVFYAVHFAVLQSLPGWPSDAQLPDTFRLISFSITEPDRREDANGETLIWAQPIEASTPRVYRMPYTRELHDELRTAQQRQAHRARNDAATDPIARMHVTIHIEARRSNSAASNHTPYRQKTPAPADTRSICVMHARQCMFRPVRQTPIFSACSVNCTRCAAGHRDTDRAEKSRLTPAQTIT